MYTFLKKARNRILRNIYGVPFFQAPADLVYQAALAEHLSYLPVLSAADMSLVETIKTEGVAITSLEALSIPSSQKFIQAAKKLVPEVPNSLSGKKDEFVVHASSQQVMQYPELFMWGLEQRLLNIAENYLGLPVAYHGMYFRRDIANQVQQKSRLWHIDMEDRKVLKIIVYIHDVNDDSGPFEYIPQPLTASVCKALNYKYGYLHDETINRVISPSHFKSCTGLSGTVVFAGTASILHRGKIPVDSDRFTMFFDYTSRVPKHPFYTTSSLPQEDLLLLAENFSQHQKDCVFWQ
jgi:hypothetical protein